MLIQIYVYNGDYNITSRKANPTVETVAGRGAYMEREIHTQDRLSEIVGAYSDEEHVDEETANSGNLLSNRGKTTEDKASLMAINCPLEMAVNGSSGKVVQHNPGKV